MIIKGKGWLKTGKGRVPWTSLSADATVRKKVDYGMWNVDGRSVTLTQVNLK